MLGKIPGGGLEKVALSGTYASLLAPPLRPLVEFCGGFISGHPLPPRLRKRSWGQDPGVL